MLKKKLCELKVGTYDGTATATMESTIFDVISLMSEKGVASIPIVDSDGSVCSDKIDVRCCSECLRSGRCPCSDPR